MAEQRTNDLVERLANSDHTRRDFIKRASATGAAASVAAVGLTQAAGAAPGPKAALSSRNQSDPRPWSLSTI